MGKRLVFLMLVFLMSVVSAASGLDARAVRSKSPSATAAASVRASSGAGKARQSLLWDGFVLRGVDGRLTTGLSSRTSQTAPDGPAPISGHQAGRGSKPNPCGSGWFFELGSDVIDYRVLLKAGTRLELLQSATLEKMTAGVNGPSVRLWGRVTKYKGENFIFPMYFLPLTKIVKPQSQTPDALHKPQQQEDRLADEPLADEGGRQPAINEPNDILEIPQEIIEKLNTRRAGMADSGQRIADGERFPTNDLQTTAENRKSLNADSVLADRTALLVKQDDGQLVFVLDALGRNVQQVSLRLLPCEALELTEGRQSAVPEPVRFKIAGIKTAYKGQHYLLLQKATRVYSHRNFDR